MSMKKLMVGAAVSAILTGTAVAQVAPPPVPGAPQEAVVNQNGQANIATIDQSYSNQGEALINQIGTEHDAFILQADFGNDVYTTPKNNAEINQMGARGLAAIAQGDPSTSTGGVGNDAKIDQYSDGDATPGVTLPDATPATFPIPVHGRLYTNAAGIGQLGGDNKGKIVQGSETRAVRANVAGIGQAGIGNESAINQLADGAGALNGQIGDNNKSLIDQHDESGLYNSGGLTPYDPEAIVIQVGSNNTSKVFQGGGDEFAADMSTFVTQYGDYNESDVIQKASGIGFQGGLVADVEQGGSSRSTIAQFAEAEEAVAASASVFQENGATSFVEQHLSGYGVSDIQASVSQSGASTSDIKQTITGAHSTGLYAEVIQVGDHNDSEIMQDITESAVGASYASSIVDQSGSGNKSKTSQTFTADGSYDFRILVTQYGVNNDSTVVQRDDATNEAIADVNLLAEVIQGGADNRALVVQENTEQNAFVEQLGTGGYSEVKQIMRGGTNFARALQSSTAHNAFSSIIQGGTHAEYSVQNVANVGQHGSEVSSTIEQVGAANNALVIQDGSVNSSTVFQGPGSAGPGFNTAQVHQFGSNSTSSLTQLGSGNAAFVTQGGAHNMSWISQIGTGNVANVTQMGDYNAAVVSQTGAFNAAFITQ